MRSRGLLTVALIVLLGAPAHSEYIPLGVGPSQAAKAGFTMTMSAPRLGNEGLHPIKIQFNPLGKKFNRQRELTLRFRPRDQYTAALDYQFECHVTIPQDATSYETTVLVPHFHRWQTCWMRAYEDGRPLGKLPTHLGIGTPVMDWGQQVGFGIIVPRDSQTNPEPWATFPDLRTLVTVFGDGPIDEQSSTARFTEKEARDYLESLDFGFARFRVLEENGLPEHWLAYSQLDVMLAPYPVLERIAAEQPEALDSLLQWISTGGQLWLYAAPADVSVAQQVFHGLPSTDDGFRYLKSPTKSLTLSQENITNAVEYEIWSRSYNQGYTSSGKTRQKVYDSLVAAKNPMAEILPRKELLNQVRLSSYGLGRVALISTDDPFPGSFQLWKGLVTQHQQWNVRHGVDYSNGNDSYWGWLIAAVGGPPVTMFIGFNAFFVVVIGPILYFSLRKKRRLYLLYFLAPSLAFLATTGLFLYAFVSDGFSNRGRIRMLTWIDARGGLDDCPIVNQARETYYTVVDSRFGLQFDRETLALPVLYSERFNYYTYRSADDSRPGDYRIEENASGRRYGGDFLQTRTQAQYLTTRPDKGPCPIEVDFSASPITVTNRWDQDFEHLVVRDKQGQYWMAGPVPAKETQPMKKTDLAAIEVLMQDYDIDSSVPNTPNVPYRIQNAANDLTYVERYFNKWWENPRNSSFVIIADVPESQFALRQCTPEQCVRVIGGFLP